MSVTADNKKKPNRINKEMKCSHSRRARRSGVDTPRRRRVSQVFHGAHRGGSMRRSSLWLRKGFVHHISNGRRENGQVVMVGLHGLVP